MGSSISSRCLRRPELRPSFWARCSCPHFLAVVFAIQLAGGILLLVNRYVPLALTLLGPVIVNVVLFHLLMAPSGLPLAIVTGVLWSLVFASVRRAFAGIFAAHTVTEARIGAATAGLGGSGVRE